MAEQVLEEHIEEHAYGLKAADILGSTAVFWIGFSQMRKPMDSVQRWGLAGTPSSCLDFKTLKPEKVLREHQLLRVLNVLTKFCQYEHGALYHSGPVGQWRNYIANTYRRDAKPAGKAAAISTLAKLPGTDPKWFDYGERWKTGDNHSGRLQSDFPGQEFADALYWVIGGAGDDNPKIRFRVSRLGSNVRS